MVAICVDIIVIVIIPSERRVRHVPQRVVRRQAKTRFEAVAPEQQLEKSIIFY